MNFDWINRIGIFYITYSWAEDMFYKIWKSIPQDAVQLVRNGRHDMKILFKNGSYIKFIPANENARGSVFDKIYYQDGIGDDVINMRIRPMLRPHGLIKLEELS